jgi:hypothetical protein
MKIVKKSLFYVDENDRIIITDKYALERFKSVIYSEVFFRLEYEPDGFFISSNHINSILFNICGVKKYELQMEVLNYSNEMGTFPYCYTREDAIKLFTAILEIFINQNN